MHEASGSTEFDAAPLSSELQNRFVAENMRRVFLLIYRIVRNVDDAQDLTQEAFIKALQRQDQLKDLEKAAHWLSRIATNTAIDFLRRSGRVNFTDLEDAPMPALRSRAESPEQRVLRGEHRQHLEAGLDILTTRERLALSLELTGLAPLFGQHVYSATQVARGKPAPDLFLFASAQMEVPPVECLVIEDSEAGVKAAIAAGMRALGFTGGGHCGPGHASRLREAGASEVFDDMRNLQDFLI